jgi:hypothetical protein
LVHVLLPEELLRSGEEEYSNEKRPVNAKAAFVAAK